jgi:hypothetical protein
MQHLSTWLMISLCAGAALGGSALQAYGLAAQYTLTVLGPTQVRGNPTIATAIAPDGATIVGDLTGGVDYNSAVEFTPIAQALSTPVSGAFDVEEGRIVGFVFDTATGGPGHYPPTAAVWEQGVVHELPRLDQVDPTRLAPHTHSMALCVNAAGDIWGAGVKGDYWYPPQGPGAQAIPIEWVDGDLLVELPTLGGAWGSVNACNDGGDSAGWSLTTAGASHCTQWTASGEVRDCHPAHGTSDSTGVALSNRGLLAANATQYGRSFGYLWQGSGLWWLLPLPGDRESKVQAMNENGEPVGRSCGTTCRAIGWKQLRPVDLLSRLSSAQDWTISQAVAISDDGLIVAQGRQASSTDFQEHVVLLTPVDTPTLAWFAWKARIYNWYVRQYVLGQRHPGR